MSEKLRLRSNGDGDVYIYIEDSSNASFAAGGDIANGVFAFNVSTSSDIEPNGTTAQITLDPAANGNITFRPRGTGDSLFDTGDVQLNAGNVDLPAVDATGSEGVITVDGDRVFTNLDTNIFVGKDAGNLSLTTGTLNVALGSNSFISATTAHSNISIGYLAQRDQQTGNHNVVIGREALRGATDGDFNIAVGSNALFRVNDPAASRNVAIGHDSLLDSTVGARNTGVGYGTLSQITLGLDNTALGYNAGSNLRSGNSDNIMIGHIGEVGDDNTIRIGTQGAGSGQQNKTHIAGVYNTTPTGPTQRLVIVDNLGQFGSTSGGSFVTNSFNTDSGSASPAAGVITMAGGSNINTSGTGSTVTFNLDNTVSISGSMTAGTGLTATTGDVTATAGNLALPDTAAGLASGVITMGGARFIHNYEGLGTGSVFVGEDAGNDTLTGGSNVGIGWHSSQALTSAVGNTSVGRESGLSIAGGNYNCTYGYQAGNLINSGTHNVLIGLQAGGGGTGITSGTYNTFIGTEAGKTAVTTGSFNTGIGYNAGSSIGTTSASNICLSNVGTAGDNNTIRIGTQGTGAGQQDTTFMAGITSQTITGSTSKPVVVETTGQLGVAGNLNLPTTNSGLTNGVININSVRTLHQGGDPSNIFVGGAAGNGTNSGTGNCALGYQALDALTTAIRCIGIGQLAASAVTQGTGTIAIGYAALDAVTTGVHNTAVGTEALGQLGATGARNTALGYLAGNSLTGTDSSNIMIGNAGTAGDNNTIRIGTQGTGNSQQDTTFMAGIYNTTPAGGNDGMVIIDSNGQLGSQQELVMPNNPAFSAYRSAAVTNVTGDGTIYNCTFNTEIFDQGGDYDTATYTFTAPVQGKYLFTFTIAADTLGAAHTLGTSQIVTSNHSYISNYSSWGAERASNNIYQYTQTCIADMDAMDTCFTKFAVYNSTKTVGFRGGDINSNFSGCLIS